MHRIHLLTVGKIKANWISEGCALFSERLSHLCDFQQSIVAASDLKEESQQLIKALEKRTGVIILLDERGKEMSSPDFARFVGDFRDSGVELTFIIGGAYGVSDEVKATVDRTLALSKMTLTHELSQLFFLEQLYRAHSILSGSGYHH